MRRAVAPLLLALAIVTLLVAQRSRTNATIGQVRTAENTPGIGR